MSFWNGVKNSYIGLVNGVEMINSQIEGLNRGLDIIHAHVIEKNNEHEEKKPFVKIKMNAHKINHNARMASIVIPKHYKYTHESIRCISEITNIIMGFMDATIENPNQRTYILKIINAVKNQQVNEYNNVSEMINATLEELYDRGLDRDADIGDKIKFLLDCETEDESLEGIMREALPKAQEALKSVLSLQSALKKKGIVIN